MHMLWFNFILGSNFIFLCFKLIIIHNHAQKQRKIKFEPMKKLNHNTCKAKFMPFWPPCYKSEAYLLKKFHGSNCAEVN